jgi:hypothetical protein
VAVGGDAIDQFGKTRRVEFHGLAIVDDVEGGRRSGQQLAQSRNADEIEGEKRNIVARQF